MGLLYPIIPTKWPELDRRRNPTGLWGAEFPKQEHRFAKSHSPWLGLLQLCNAQNAVGNPPASVS